MLGGCFAFILVEFVLFMILAFIFSKGGKRLPRERRVGLAGDVFDDIVWTFLTTALAYYYLMATLDGS